MRNVILAALLAACLAPTIASARPSEAIRMRITHYTSCDVSIRRVKACDGRTASGRYAQWGIVACGPAYRFGTVFDIPGVGLFACYDRGGGIGNNHLDVWVPTGKWLFREGTRWLNVTVRNDIDPQDVLNGTVVSSEPGVEQFAAFREEGEEGETAVTAADSPVVGALVGAAKREGAVESSLGNLVTDMLRTQYNADVGLIHNGGLGPGLPAGEVKAAHVAAAVGPIQKPLSLDLRGDQLKRILEYGLAHLGEDNSRLLQVSGLRIVYDPEAPVGSRLVSLIHTGKKEPVWDGAFYRVILTDTLYLTEGYTELFEVGRGLITYEPLMNMASKWLAQRGKVTPAVEGRITAR